MKILCAEAPWLKAAWSSRIGTSEALIFILYRGVTNPVEYRDLVVAIFTTQAILFWLREVNKH